MAKGQRGQSWREWMAFDASGETSVRIFITGSPMTPEAVQNAKLMLDLAARALQTSERKA